jgi:hypothetical protein
VSSGEAKLQSCSQLGFKPTVPKIQPDTAGLSFVDKLLSLALLEDADTLIVQKVIRLIPEGKANLATDDDSLMLSACRCQCVRIE